MEILAELVFTRVAFIVLPTNPSTTCEPLHIFERHSAAIVDCENAGLRETVIHKIPELVLDLKHCRVRCLTVKQVYLLFTLGGSMSSNVHENDVRNSCHALGSCQLQ